MRYFKVERTGWLIWPWWSNETDKNGVALSGAEGYLGWSESGALAGAIRKSNRKREQIEIARNSIKVVMVPDEG